MSSALPSSRRPDAPSVGLHIFAGLCASLVGIGLARFAYTPLIPPLIEAHWFAAADVVTLGAANLGGYLLGALLGRPLAARVGAVACLRWMMVLVTLAFVGCAFPLSLAWFFGWRLVSGVAGGAMMVLVAATVLPHVPPARKGVASGAIFLGVGLGVAASGTVVPLLLNFGLRNTWLGLAMLSAVLTAASWFAWPASTPVAKPASAAPATAGAPAAGLAVLYVQYALMAIGLVPPMVFLVDFIARGLGAGAHLGSLFWVVYGLGSIAGPPLYGLLADRLGPRPTVRLALAVQVLVLAGAWGTGSLALLALLTLVIGSFPSGIVPLVLAHVHESVPHDAARQNQVWSRATTVFAAAQAAAGYGFSALFNASGGNYRLLFICAAAALLVALLAELGRRPAVQPLRGRA
ncbi:YbfB/YjiJ family MFS transporter [Xylophilus rhododendri]|uniref:YbfB/YjiJ family MFS transporter n=1 Tax=Xylophilus rhododendri TaxID=2697032 RepID=A0A857JCG6_9BURK|nr:YbfB/YjiJ family MFS transporter [Xylophilus rhododendri]QHJ00376.1 YbfB/YjiJ family MFS transporter [Xylophilus rhododendri]